MYYKILITIVPKVVHLNSDIFYVHTALLHFWKVILTIVWKPNLPKGDDYKKEYIKFCKQDDQDISSFLFF
jgi:hypothetical protein